MGYFLEITTEPLWLRTDSNALASPYEPRIARLLPRRSRGGWSFRPTARRVTGTSDRTLPLNVSA